MEQIDQDAYQETSQPFIGQWNNLISTTNWEKGRIIHEWRSALIAEGAAATEYSDEAWANRVGNVTSQHIGRLRRVWDRFGEFHDQYEDLYWSHFQAAIDWEDAEMWLEGAIQSTWSVSEMRRQRWEAHGASEDLKPRDEDIYVGELDEDAAADDETAVAGVIQPEIGLVQNTGSESDDLDEGDEDEEPSDAASKTSRQTTAETSDDAPEVRPTVRPFAELPSLPPDLSEALESFKLAILRHKVAGWAETSADDVIAALQALEALALAPADDATPV